MNRSNHTVGSDHWCRFNCSQRWERCFIYSKFRFSTSYLSTEDTCSCTIRTFSVRSPTFSGFCVSLSHLSFFWHDAACLCARHTCTIFSDHLTHQDSPRKCLSDWLIFPAVDSSHSSPTPCLDYFLPHSCFIRNVFFHVTDEVEPRPTLEPRKPTGNKATVYGAHKYMRNHIVSVGTDGHISSVPSYSRYLMSVCDYMIHVVSNHAV